MPRVTVITDNQAKLLISIEDEDIKVQGIQLLATYV